MSKSKPFATLCGRIFRDANVAEYPSTEHRNKKIILCSQTCLDSFLEEPTVLCKVHLKSEKTAEQIKAELSSIMDSWRQFYDSSKKND
jgi:DNA anti-recombination protein RmuC